MATTKKLMGTTAAAADGALAIEDVFSTYLYTGNGSTQTITNGIDLAGEGGLVWAKWRDGVGDHSLVDTARGTGQVLFSNSTASSSNFLTYTVKSFNSDGFSVESHPTENVSINWSGNSYASWTFRKAPRFFDVVTYTGDGVAGREIAHNLGTTVGTLIIRRTDSSQNWFVWHRAYANNQWLVLNDTYDLATTGTTGELNNTTPTDSVFTVGSGAITNASGGTYVAYLFAHDPLGPSGDGSDGLIACGSYTGNGSTTGPEINLGWEPQWLLLKGASSGVPYDWRIHDVMRGFTADGNGSKLEPNTADAEDTAECRIRPLPTGFQPTSNAGLVNASGETYIYIAIRRGPMRQPTSGTEVYTAGLNSSGSYTVSTGWPADFAIQKDRSGTLNFSRPYARLTGTNYLETTSTAAEASGGSAGWANNTGYSNVTVLSTVDWVFRRAPGFFDVVAYTGDGVAGRTVPHNLGVAPELMIVKPRSVAGDWWVYQKDMGESAFLQLNNTNAVVTSNAWLNNTAPSASEITFNLFTAVNGSGSTYIAYLFATLPGVSKVGSYTGTGTNWNVIDCGFTSGARFVLIKKTSGTSQWYVFDVERGITTTDQDGVLYLNSTAAEGTENPTLGIYNVIEPDASGFSVRYSDLNDSGASYIFLAIA